jgi:hypothetical protein
MHFAWSPVGVPADFEIFDVSGARHWRARLNGASGEYVWPGTGESGELLPAGVYFARLRGRGMELSSRIVLMR